MKLLGVEAARGIAALLVLLLHAASMLADDKDYGRLVFGGFFTFGRAGVDFFFVLSGFIITYVHYNDLGRATVFTSFWRKRLLRIYPTYWAAFAVLGAILAVSPTRSRAEQNPVHILFSLLLLPEAVEPILGVAWSLRHELVFYVLFSIAILHRRLGIAVLATWFAVVLANSIWSMATGAPYLSGELNTVVFRVFNIQFLAGIAVAVLVRRGIAYRPGAMLAVGIAVFMASGMAESFLPPVQHEWPPRHWAYAIGSGLTLYGLAVLDLRSAWTVPRPFLVLGAASYSLYLVHVTALILAQQVLRRFRPVLDIPLEISYAIMVATGLAAGVVFHRIVERPVLRFANRRFPAARNVS